MDKQVIIQALRSEIPDFEDAIQESSAKHEAITIIVTRNEEDFKKSDLQVLNPESSDVFLDRLAEHLGPLGEVSYNDFMLRFRVDGHEIVVFPDGRAIVKNTDDETLARGLYAKYIGM